MRTDSSQPDGACFKALVTLPSDKAPHTIRMMPMMTNSSTS
jgi:hypothetical protein